MLIIKILATLRTILMFQKNKNLLASLRLLKSSIDFYYNFEEKMFCIMM